jgi:hypothetical protein
MDEFFDLVDTEVTDDYLRQVHGHEAEQDIDLPEVKKPLLEVLIDGQISAFNDCVSGGRTAKAALHYRLIVRLLESDGELREAFEKHQSQHPLASVFGETEF